MSDDTIDAATVKSWAIAMVAEVEPGDVFVVEDCFDNLVEDWHRAGPQDEGRFFGGEQYATFAAIVVPFLIGFFGDIAKDVVKDQSKKAAGALIDRFLKRKSSGDEASRLRREIDTAIAGSRFSEQQKSVLRAGFSELFSKLSLNT